MSTRAGIEASCDFCACRELRPVYEVPDSASGMVVAICSRCGLAQSIQGTERVAERIVSTSSGAGWGNIRHGKGLRLKFAVPLLESIVRWDKVRKVLDVGSNRGDFVRWVSSSHPGVELVGVEPDRSIVNEYKALSSLTLYQSRFENISLEPESVDLVYCSHTLEHADSGARMVQQMSLVLRDEGYLFIEVPNLRLVAAPDVAEEFFIDKHRFHYSHALLIKYLASMGFALEKGGDVSNAANITLLLMKKGKAEPRMFSARDTSWSSDNQRMIVEYARRLEENRGKLKEVVRRLHAFLARQKVAFWGGGRLFDALVRYGGLDTARISCVVDEYLWKLVPAVHGVVIQRPETLKIVAPQVVVILARDSAAEIAAKARQLGVKNVVKFSDLFLAVK